VAHEARRQIDETETRMSGTATQAPCTANRDAVDCQLRLSTVEPPFVKI